MDTEKTAKRNLERILGEMNGHPDLYPHLMDTENDWRSRMQIHKTTEN